jgi:hypothetical protein
MSIDREELIQLFDAKVQSFEAPVGARFHALLPFKEGILRLRAKKASCRTIVALLKQLGVTVSHNTVARFCRELCAPAAPNGSRRIATKPAAAISSKPQPPAVAEILSRRHDGGKTPDTASSPRGRGPRIADPRNV